MPQFFLQKLGLDALYANSTILQLFQPLRSGGASLPGLFAYALTHFDGSCVLIHFHYRLRC